MAVPYGMVAEVGREELRGEPAAPKTMAGTPLRMSSPVRSRTSSSVSPLMPSSRFRTGGLMKAITFSPAGAPLSAMSWTGAPTSRSACSCGLPMVALVQMNWGSLP